MSAEHLAVWHWELPPDDRFNLAMPIGTEFLYSDLKLGVPCIWCRVRVTIPQLEVRARFRMVSTGSTGACGKYLGSFHFDRGRTVTHLFSEDL